MGLKVGRIGIRASAEFATAVIDIGDGIESAAHLSQSLIKRDTFVPRIDYSNPSNFAKYGSAEKYYQDDGIHLNRLGARILSISINEYLQNNVLQKFGKRNERKCIDLY